MTNIFKKGFVRSLILLAIAVIILSVVGIDFKKVSENRLVESNFGFIFTKINLVVEKYAKKPVNFVVHIWKEYIIGPLLNAIQNIRTNRNPFEGIIPFASPPFLTPSP